MLGCGEGKGRSVGGVKERVRCEKCVGVWGEVWKTVGGGVGKCWGGVKSLLGCGEGKGRRGERCGGCGKVC